MPLSPTRTYTGPAAGALFVQNGWASTTETNRFPRTGWPGPELDFQLGTASANRCNHWIGSGPYTLQLIPNNVINNNLAWGHIVYPLQSLRTDQDWEIAIDVSLSNTPYTNKPARIVIGLCRSPVWAGRNQTVGQDGSPFNGINGYGPLDCRIQAHFRPFSTTGTGSVSMSGTVATPISNGTGYQNFNTGSTSATGANWADGSTRVLRAIYTASTGNLDLTSGGVQVVTGSADPTTWATYNLTTKNLIGNQGFPYLFFATGVTGPSQGITLNEWGAWGTFGNLVLPRTGVPTAGATAATDVFDSGMSFNNIPVTKVDNPAPIVIYRPQAIVVPQPSVKLAEPSGLV